VKGNGDREGRYKKHGRATNGDWPYSRYAFDITIVANYSDAHKLNICIAGVNWARSHSRDNRLLQAQRTFLRARAPVVYNFAEILSRVRVNFEEQNEVLRASVIIINYCITYINA
jgi:hypothetical protein